MRPRPRRPRLAGATSAAVLVAALLAGCSESDTAGSGDASTTPRASASGTGTPSASPVVSTSPSPTPRAPRLPRPPKVKADTTAARKAFTRFVVARWGYALATNDAGAVTGLSPQGHPCEGCKDFAAELARRHKQHWYVAFPGARVRSVTLAPPPGLPQVYVTHATVDIPRSQSFFRSGALRNDNPAHRGATFDVEMHYGHQRYTLLAFRVR